MTTREKYQGYLDAAYRFAPFRVVRTHDLKHMTSPFPYRHCEVCGNRRLRYICECKDKDGKTWYIGMNCHTHLEERYEEEHKKAKLDETSKIQEAQIGYIEDMLGESGGV